MSGVTPLLFPQVFSLPDKFLLLFDQVEQYLCLQKQLKSLLLSNTA